MKSGLKNGHMLVEDYARGIPDFVLSQVATQAADSMLQHIKRHIQQVAQDAVKQRQMLGAANLVMQELEDDIKQLLEDRLLDFIRSV